MRAVSVDPIDRSALVQGGALWSDVDHETQAHGLATTGGIVSHTGVGGLSLGGGMGWLMRKCGLAVDNIVEAEVVTANGEIVRASANDHPDLFWALRGGGGNFGVVSSFRFALHPIGPTVMAGPVFWPAEDTTDVLHFYRDFVTDAPDELGTVIRLGAPSVRSVKSGHRSSTWWDPRSMLTTRAASTTPSRMAGATTGKRRTSPAYPTRSSTSSPSTPTTQHRRGRTR
jgi:FAD/FMN-containing dehydrogenase